MLIKFYSDVKRYKNLCKGSLHAFLFVLQKRLLRSKESAFALQYKKIPFLCRNKDWVALEEIFLKNEYECISTLFSRCAPKVIVDAGANIGLFSIFCFSLFPEATVFSYEASRDTFKVMEKNKKLSPAMNWVIYQAALWENDNAVSFDNREFSTASRISKPLNSIGNETVAAVSFSTLLKKCGGKIDLLKLDIEGAEEEFLFSSPNSLSCVENLIIEIHPHDCDEQRVYGLLKKHYANFAQINSRTSSKPLLLATNKVITARSLSKWSSD